MTTQAALLAPRPASPLGSRRRRRRLRALLLLLPGIALVAAFLYCPLALVVQLSLTEADSFLSPTGAIATTANYGALADRYLPNVLVTLQLATLASIVDLVFGFPFAYILVRRVRYRNIVRALMVFPMFGALYVAFGMRFMLLPGGILAPVLGLLGIQSTSLLYSLPSVVFAMAIFSFPFMVMSISTALANVDPTLEEAAACLGARSDQTFRRVIIPLCRSGIVAGCLMVFGWSIGTFAEPLLLGTPAEQRSLAWTLYQRGVVQTDYGLATAMGVALMAIAFAVTYLSLRFSRGALVD